MILHDPPNTFRDGAGVHWPPLRNWLEFGNADTAVAINVGVGIEF